MPPLIKWIMLLFGAWLVWLCVTSLLAKRKNLRQAKEAQQWPPVSGRILTSQIIEGHSRDSETQQTIFTYRPEVEYEYEAGGAALKSTRIAFGKVLFYQQSEAEAFMQAHAKESTVPVYYDPAQSAEAVLNRDPSIATQLVIADFAMMALGLALMGAGIYGMVAG